MRHALATVFLGPLLLLQGRWVRARIPVLLEPPGSRRGQTTGGDGEGLRLLLVGDSSGAGVGAAHQNEALLGRTVSALSEAGPVTWRAEARTGATTAGTVRHMETVEADTFDVAVTALGVNDAVAGVRRDAWLADQRRLRRLLRERFGVTRIVVSGFPPVHGFPALPQPLRWYLGRRCRELDAALRAEIASEPDVGFLPVDFVMDPTAMARDGFHPGPRVYQAWGQRAADLLLTLGTSA